MRHQIENNRREVSEQWEVMQDIKTQHNEIMIMIENLQTTIYNSGLLKEIIIQPRFRIPEKQIPASGKRVMVVVDGTKEERAKSKQPTTIQTLKEKKSRPYSFLRSKTIQIFEQALKSGLTLPACKRLADIDKADEGEFFAPTIVCWATRLKTVGYSKISSKRGIRMGQFSSRKASNRIRLRITQMIKAKGSPTQFHILPYQTSQEL
jgi:hypothetical protein